LGSIAATLVVIDQPLIQRASTIVSVPRNYNYGVIFDVAPDITWGYPSYLSGRSLAFQVMTPPTISAFNNYSTQQPITTGLTAVETYAMVLFRLVDWLLNVVLS
jgi:hypothetical protein